MADALPFCMSQVLDLVNAEYQSRGNQVWVDVKCPVNKKQNIRVNLENGTWSCFHECANCPHHPEKGSAGMLDVYCLFRGVSTRSEANKEIREALYGTGNSMSPARAIMPAIKFHSDDVPLASIEVRDRVYRALLSKLPLTATHCNDLVKRGLNKKDIARGMFRSVPQSGLLQVAKSVKDIGYDPKGVPGFYVDKNGEYRLASRKTGYYIPYFDIEGRIEGLQIRYDITITPDMDAETKKALKARRYRWLSSTRNYKGTGAENFPYFGNHPNLESFCKDGKLVVYTTEGGLKAFVAESLCESVYGSKRVFAAIPGVTTYDTWRKLIATLKAYALAHNVTLILVDAFDSDRYENPSVERSIGRLKDICENEFGVEFAAWNWGRKYKGCDDYLLARSKYIAGIIA